MNTHASSPFLRRALAAFAAACALALSSASADESSAVLDTFDDAAAAPSGLPRTVITDAATGGQSRLEQSYEGGVLSASGEIAPSRGQPGWVSMALLLTPDGSPKDLSQYQGIRLKVRVKQGMLAVSANSAEVDNFDYHSSLVPQKPGKELQEVRIPFKSMKRAWSQQTPLNPATISSVSLTAVDMQKAPFAYEIDEIGFY